MRDIDIYDTPDGEDCLRKTTDSTFLGAKIGAILSIYDIVGRSTGPKTFSGMAGRVLHFTLPAAGVGAVYSCTSCVAGNIRGKDGPLNHFMSAALSMSVLGIKYGQKFAFMAMVPVGLGAALVKHLRMEGHDVLPDLSKYQKDFGTSNHYKYHFGPRTEVKEPTDY